MLSQVGFSLGPLLTAEEVLQFAKMADVNPSAHSIWVPESWGRETFSTLGGIAALTKKILIGSSIINIYSRTPATIAMGAATVDSISGGRMILGLGSSTEAIVSGLHGLKFQRPLSRMTDYVDCIRQLLSGNKVEFRGKVVSSAGFRLLNASPRKSIPIYLGAVNPRMMKLAASTGDGILFYLRPLESLKTSVSEILEVTKGRQFKIALSLICSVSDQNPEAARLRAATTLAFYIAVGKIYGDYLYATGFEDEVQTIRSLYSKGGSQEGAKGVSDRMLQSLTVCGSVSECRSSIKRFVSEGITLPILQVNPVPSTEGSFTDGLKII